ncbi:MAG: ImmA/IrrE family metallo-endopeptidase [Dehalococcoidales bacterium]|nr:ImmA/IrrE family metallo-endopeptidase [Dehalococcoidales bacterium]
MTSDSKLHEFCRYVLDCEEGQYPDDPVYLGGIFREYAGIQRTPTLSDAINIITSLDIKVNSVDYLPSGGTNMNANGQWYIHYSDKERPATQKFTLFHELFEIINKSFGMYHPEFIPLKEPKMSRNADRFAASALIPPRFFLGKVNSTGCDLVKLGEDLELSHHCLLIALGQHLSDIQFVGILYESNINRNKSNGTRDVKDFVATVVVKTPRSQRVKYLCGLQSVPPKKEYAQFGSLVCAAITGGRSLLWRNDRVDNAPAILVRPLIANSLEPYRVILLAVPGDEFSMISSQVELLDPLPVNGETCCSFESKCLTTSKCLWKSIGG